MSQKRQKLCGKNFLWGGNAIEEIREEARDTIMVEEKTKTKKIYFWRKEKGRVYKMEMEIEIERREENAFVREELFV
jgi:hypothetical protein